MKASRIILSISMTFAFLFPTGPSGHFFSPPLSCSREEVATDRAEEVVQFNTKSLKYHKPTCVWAQRCTRNCIPMKRKDAIRRGGVPCKVCGG